LAVIANDKSVLRATRGIRELQVERLNDYADILQEKGYVFAMEGTIDDLQEVKEQLALSEAFSNRYGKAVDICSGALYDLDLAVIENTKKNPVIKGKLRRIIKKAQVDICAVLSGAQPETE